MLKSIGFVLATVLLTFGFLDEEKSLTEIFVEAYKKDFSDLVLKAESFEKELKNQQTKTVANRYFELRKAYKKIEPIYLYFDRAAVERNLNGAPLPKIELNTPGAVVLDPKGLQVIDELMGEENINSREILKQLKDFKEKLQLVNNTIKLRTIDHRRAIEIYQLSLVKMFTLEQSGFDTPGTLNGLEDSKTTIESINKILYPFLQQFSKIKPEIDQLQKLMKKTEAFVKDAQDLKSFNYAAFLSSCLEPLYAQVNIVHAQSGVEYYDEVARTPMSFNTRSNHIFSDDFLNPAFYSRMDLQDQRLIELGKTLFYDPILSKNNKRACASCHDPQKGFTDQLAKSHAFDFKGTVDRNAPTLLNAIYASDYFWDLRAQKIDMQVEHVIFSSKEFNTGFKEIEGKLKSSEEYVKLFEENFTPFRGEVINKNNLNAALAAFVQSLRGWNSEFDKYARGEENMLSNEAKKGFNLFMGKAQCAICHFPPSFSGLVPPYFEDSESEVLGMLTQFDTINPVLDQDLGRYASSKVGQDVPHYKNSIKTATVRNAQITFPYMHNGAFKNLEEVIHFYNHGGGVGLGLEVENQTLPDSKLNLSNKEIKAIESFINSLTDTNSVDLTKPKKLPAFGGDLDKRVIGGEY